MRIYISFLSALLLICSIAMAADVDVPETPKAMLASYLGVEEDLLTPEVDLVMKLHIDQQELYQAIVILCDELGVQPPDTELTKLADILAWVETGPPVVRMRGIGQKKNSSIVQRVYFATSRKKTGLDKPEEFFGQERSDSLNPYYGYVDVSIPLNHKEGHIESPLLRLEFLNDPKKYFMLQHLEGQDEAVFYQDLSSLLSTSADLQDGVVVFVHGFNVTFSDAVMRTAQLVFDSGFRGIPITYSWPSDGQMTAYVSDREDVVWSIGPIEQFLRKLRKKFPDKKVHLVAHSMGSQGLIGALFRMSLRSEESKPFETVILAAPDFDADYFQKQIAPDVRSLAKQWIIYTSDKDSALDFSKTLNSMKRLGQPITPLAGMQVIDATGLEVTPWNVPQFHSYYATKKKVLDDLLGALRGITPDQRHLKEKKQVGIAYWAF